MPEQRLHCAQGCAYCIQQRRIRMPQPMPVPAHQVQLLAGRLELPTEQIVPIKRRARASAEDQDLRDLAQRACELTESR